MCKFDERCTKLLCGYRHKIIDTSNVDIEASLDDPEDQANKKIVDSDSFNYDEYEESKEMVCNEYCDLIYGYHLHYDDLYKQYFGVDTPNIRERIIPVTKEHSFAYPCKMCEIFSTNLDVHQQHIKVNHADVERTLSCVIDKCEYTSLSPEMLARHIAVKHNEFIKKRMKQWQE